MNRYNKLTIQKLEQVFKELGYIVRYEKGNFNSGYCILENTKVAVVNKFFDTEARAAVLIEILEKIMTDDSPLSDKSRIFIRNLMKSREIQQSES